MSVDILLPDEFQDGEVEATPAEGSAQDPGEGLLEPSLVWYMREIGRYPLLTAGEEAQLALTRESGEVAARQAEQLPADDPRWAALEAEVRAGEAARRHLVESNLRLVLFVARRYAGKGLPLPDLIQEGNIGLERAATRYDPHTGWRFSTYAFWWIRQAISRAMANDARQVRLPVHVVTRLTAISRAQHELEQETEAPAQLAAIAARLGLPVRHVREALWAARSTLSLDAPPPALMDEELTLADVLADPDAPAPDTAAARTVLVSEVERVLQSLTPREQVVLKLRFGLGRWVSGDSGPQTLPQIGGQLGLSTERVRQIQDEALAKLRTMSAVQQLREYLD